MMPGRSIGHIWRHLSNRLVQVRAEYRHGLHVGETVECGERDTSALRFALTSKETRRSESGPLVSERLYYEAESLALTTSCISPT